MTDGNPRATETSGSTTIGTPVSGNGVPWTTWIFGGAALIVVMTAGALLMGEKPEADSHVAEAPIAETKEDVPDPLEALTKKNPLNITPSLLDAHERAKVWSATAMLSRIDLVIDDGKPVGPIVFEFGDSVGQPIPGGSLGARRYAISYDGEAVTAEETKTTKTRIALADPNCPVDVAFRKLLQSGAGASGAVGALYVNSSKHARPIWVMSEASGAAFSMSADTCAMLRR